MIRILRFATLLLLAGLTGQNACPPAFAAGTAAEHPLAPVIRFAEARLAAMDAEIRDYTCTLVKRERIDGRLQPYHYIFLKLRHERVAGGRGVTPLSVYLRYLAPDDVKDREAIYVRGHNKGKVIARRGGLHMPYVTTAVSPTSDLALQGNHYPVTEIGMKNLVERLLEVGREELAQDECDVKYLEGAKLNGRTCLVIEISHPVRRDYFRYHLARIFIDQDLMIPVHYSSYDWPAGPGEPPLLIEEYNYVNVKLNVGLTDHDFDHRNEEYRFRKTFEP